MAKSGQARVHPEKNTAIMQISLKLGLRAQEIALLQIKKVCSVIYSGLKPRAANKDALASNFVATPLANAEVRTEQDRGVLQSDPAAQPHRNG